MYYLIMVLFGLVLFELVLLLAMDIYSKISDWWNNLFNGRID